jgi:hypothetical protein
MWLCGAELRLDSSKYTLSYTLSLSNRDKLIRYAPSQGFSEGEQIRLLVIHYVLGQYGVGHTSTLKYSNVQQLPISHIIMQQIPIAVGIFRTAGPYCPNPSLYRVNHVR